MVILNASKNDLNEIMEIERACFSVPWSESGMVFEIESDDAYFAVAKEEGKILGFVILHCFEDEGEIFNVAVREEYRNKKIGTKLIASAKKFAEKNRLTKIFLEVRESNLNAIKLYAGSGFEKLGVRKNYYDEPKENAIMMVCNMERGAKR